MMMMIMNFCHMCLHTDFSARQEILMDGNKFEFLHIIIIENLEKSKWLIFICEQFLHFNSCVLALFCALEVCLAKRICTTRFFSKRFLLFKFTYPKVCVFMSCRDCVTVSILFYCSFFHFYKHVVAGTCVHYQMHFICYIRYV